MDRLKKEDMLTAEDMKKLIELSKSGFCGDDLVHYKEELEKACLTIFELYRQEYGPFICGYGKEDEEGRPETFTICYNLGVNYCGLYKLVHKGRTGQ